jgi:hypothetical protein
MFNGVTLHALANIRCFSGSRSSSCVFLGATLSRHAVLLSTFILSCVWHGTVVGRIALTKPWLNSSLLAYGLVGDYSSHESSWLGLTRLLLPRLEANGHHVVAGDAR